MKTLLIFHETESGDHWANAWHHGEGGRHQMFDKLGVKVRTFRDPNNPDLCGGIWEILDMKAFEEFIATDEVQKGMAEDGLKVETLRMLEEFTTE